MAKKSNKTKKNVSGENDSWLFKAIHGRMLSTDFFVKNWGKILCMVIMLLVFITNKYNCQTRMETIQSLTRQLEVVKTERIRERSKYMSRTRETGMQELVDSMHLNLHIQERPPFQIKY
ncbi:MAG: hypothetical protein K2J42_06285 [Muribaculaceae bacterium]|nr:hypothetical protein [Muribaculaceae bacterium]